MSLVISIEMYTAGASTGLVTVKVPGVTDWVCIGKVKRQGVHRNAGVSSPRRWYADNAKFGQAALRGGPEDAAKDVVANYLEDACRRTEIAQYIGLNAIQYERKVRK